MKRSVLFSPPRVGESEIRAVTRVLRSEWITTGPETRRFEEDFRRFTGARAALAVSSCTAALHLALATLKIGPGDAVITTPLTFCSGVHVIEHVGARPLLADVESETLNLDPAAVEKVILKNRKSFRIRAIMPVHFAGHPCDMKGIFRVARKYGLRIIEDAAHALPAKYGKKMIGTLGDFTAFSFYATKNMTTAEGGMLTGSPALVEKARILSLHGMSRDAWKRYSAKGSWYYEVVEAGFKYNLPDILSALGRVQLARLPEFQKRRRAVVAEYNRAFHDSAEFQIPVVRSGVEHAWHLYVLRLNSEKTRISRNILMEHLRKAGIGASVHFIPVHLHPYYRKKYGFRPDDFPVAYREYQRMLSLPLHPGLTHGEIRRVIRAVQSGIRKGAL